MAREEKLLFDKASYAERIVAFGGDEEIEICISIPLEDRLAELVDRSAVREFFGEYDEKSKKIVLCGQTEHGGCFTIKYER